MSKPGIPENESLSKIDQWENFLWRANLEKRASAQLCSYTTKWQLGGVSYTAKWRLCGVRYTAG
jgi:hypothetical protein